MLQVKCYRNHIVFFGNKSLPLRDMCLFFFERGNCQAERNGDLYMRGDCCVVVTSFNLLSFPGKERQKEGLPSGEDSRKCKKLKKPLRLRELLKGVLFHPSLQPVVLQLCIF